jgi:hypothetical protein
MRSRMHRSIVLCLLLIPALGACASSPAQHPVGGVHAGESFGWLHGNCLAIKNPGIEKHRDLTLILLDDPQSLAKATVLGKADSGEECFALLEDRRTVNVAEGYSFYLIDTDAQANLGIGMLGTLDDMRKYTFHYCTTTEGVAFKVNEKGREIWRGYYYLGYESEATCESD